MLLVVLWLLIGTRSRLLVEGLLSIAEVLCPARCLLGTILVTMCLMVWRVLRAEPMLSCWHDLLFLFCLYCFIFFFIKWVGCVKGWVLNGSPAFHSGLQLIIITNNKLEISVAVALCSTLSRIFLYKNVEQNENENIRVNFRVRFPVSSRGN